MAGFSKEFWHNLGKLSIYSTEAADDDQPTLSDQMDASVPGGANASDNTDSAPADDGLGDDMNLGDMGGDDIGGDTNLEGGDETAGEDGVSDSSDTEMSEPQNPNENPFKGSNGKSLLDDKFAELQTAVADTLERIYAKPQVEQVVVSELENLADSIRNIRETIFVVPIDASLYKYQLSTISYKNLSKLICDSLKEK